MRLITLYFLIDPGMELPENLFPFGLQALIHGRGTVRHPATVG